MKNLTLFLFFYLGFLSHSLGQKRCYSYDLAGNRILRDLSCDISCSSCIPAWKIKKISLTYPNNYDQVGDLLIYQLDLENTGNVNINMITVNDSLATTGPIYQSGDLDNDNILGPGEIWIYGATYEVTQADINAGSFRNTATAKGTPPQGTILEDVSDEEIISAIQNPEIQLEMASTRVPNRFSYVGDILTYHLSVTNTGNVTLRNVEISDQKLTVVGSLIPSLSPGQKVILSASYTIVQDDLNNGQFENLTTVVGRYTNLNGDTLTVNAYDNEIILGFTPDVTQVVTTIPNVVNGVTDINITVRVSEINNVTTNGLIIVRIPKDVRITLINGYNSNLNQLGSVTLNNNLWNYTQDGSYHIFNSNSPIIGGQSSIFGFVATFNPQNSNGTFTISSQIISGSGGEVMINNNVDSERLSFFID